jgi:hypothetical protein
MSNKIIRVKIQKVKKRKETGWKEKEWSGLKKCKTRRPGAAIGRDKFQSPSL